MKYPKRKMVFLDKFDFLDSNENETGGNMNKQLTEEQIKNWRRVLIGIFGPYALIMPKEQIQAHRDQMQESANRSLQPTLKADG